MPAGLPTHVTLVCRKVLDDVGGRCQQKVTLPASYRVMPGFRPRRYSRHVYGYCPAGHVVAQTREVAPDRGGSVPTVSGGLPTLGRHR